MKTKKNYKKFINNSADSMVELFEMKSEQPELSNYFDKMIQHQQRINTFLLKECFDLNDDYEVINGE